MLACPGMRVLGITVLALVLNGCVSARVAENRAIEKAPGAAAQPLHDINVLRTKIPPVLLEAMDRPYVPPSPMNCREIANQVRPLDEALGPDLDAPPSTDNPSALERGGEAAGDAMANVIRGAATDLIPLRSWVRMLTGAERHDEYVRAAIVAGGVRRGYLKGIGLQADCLPPSSPQPIAIRGEQVRKSPPPRTGPQYPIH